VEVSLSLVGAFRFSEEVTRALGAAAQQLNGLTTTQETDSMTPEAPDEG
jgi:hypothetical protein